MDEMTPSMRQELSMNQNYQKLLDWVRGKGTVVGSAEKTAFAELFLMSEKGEITPAQIGGAYAVFLKARKTDDQYASHTAIAFARNVSFWVDRIKKRPSPGQSPQINPKHREPKGDLPTHSELEEALRRMRDRNPALYRYCLNRFEKGGFSPVVLNLMQDPCHAGQPLPKAPEKVSFTGGF